MQWIKYLSTTKGVHIQHARNGGEREIGPYKVDGYYENENGEKYVLEFNGKFWHGCLRCYNASTVNPVNGITMGDLYQRTIEKKRYLDGQGHVYVGKWECEFDREVRENDTLRNCVQLSEMINPLEPRDAFYGGRTEAFTLLQKDQDISYVDVTSLYPYINKTGKIPIGHPEIVTEGFTDIQQYEGMQNPSTKRTVHTRITSKNEQHIVVYSV
jgi:hypothetical protein